MPGFQRGDFVANASSTYDHAVVAKLSLGAANNLNPRSRQMNRPTKSAFTKKALILVALNVCFFSYLAFWLFHDIDFGNLSQRLRETPPRAILTAMTLNSFVLVFFAKRLSIILGGRFMPCFLITTIGFTCNAIAPFRVGEGVKIYFGARSYKFPLIALGTAVAGEKLYDATAIAALSLVVAASSNAAAIGLQNLLVVPALIAAALLAVLSVRTRLIGDLGRRFAARFSRAIELGLLFEQAKSLIVSHNALRAAFFTTMIWMTNILLVFLTFRTILGGSVLNLLDAMTLVLISALAIAVPSSPAGLGVVEAGIVAYLTNFHGVEKEQALSAALAYHFSITAPHTLIVVAFLLTTLFRLLRTRPLQQS